MNELSRLRAEVDAIRGKLDSYLSGGDVYARRVYFTGGTIGGTPGSLPWIGIMGSNIVAEMPEAIEEATFAETFAAAVALSDAGSIQTERVIPGIVVAHAGDVTNPQALGGGTVRVYGIPLRPVSGSYEGETEFDTGYFDLDPFSIHLVSRGQQLSPFGQFTYDATTGYITTGKAPFASGATVPDTPSSVFFCFCAERRLGGV